MGSELYLNLEAKLISCIRQNDHGAVSRLMGSLTDIELEDLINDKNIHGQPLLFHACQAKSSKIVEYLIIECGANINTVSKVRGEKLTPLLLSIKNQNTFMLLKLIRLQADLSVKDRKKRNALVYACLNRNHEAAEILLANQVDINSDMNVHYCAEDEKYLKMALKFGTDTQYTDSAGNTVFMKAALNGKLEVLSLLEKRNCKLYHRNNSGANALDLANFKERKEVTRFLSRFYSRYDYALSLEYCGAYALVFFKSLTRCLSFWNASIVQRRNYCNQISPKSNFAPTDFPLNTREFEIDTDLNSREEKDLLIDALLVFYRILSPESLVTKKAFYCVVLSRCPDVDIKTRFTLLNHVMRLNASVTPQDDREIFYSWQVLVRLTTKYFCIIENTGTTIDEISELAIEFMETIRDYVKPFLRSNPRRILLYVEKYKSLQTMGLRYLQYLVNEVSTPEYRSLAVSLAKALRKEDSETSMTVLHLAVSKKMSCAVVELLIECGSDVNAVDEKGNTPLHLLIERPLTDPAREEIARVLVRAGGDLNAINNSNVVLREHFGSLQTESDVQVPPV